MSIVDYLIRLSATDRYRHQHKKAGGEIVYFRVQIETEVQGEWYPVVQYDTAHGFAHRDLLDMRGHIQKTPLFHMTYNEALTFAEQDLKSNWKHYKRQFLQTAPGDTDDE